MERGTRGGEKKWEPGRLHSLLICFLKTHQRAGNSFTVYGLGLCPGCSNTKTKLAAAVGKLLFVPGAGSNWKFRGNII